MFNLFRKKPELNSEMVDLTQKFLSKIVIIEQYKPLSNKGKYEALICCSFLEMAFRPDRDINPEEFSNKLINHLLNIRKEYKVSFSKNKTINLINSRMAFYDDEMRKLSSGNNINGNFHYIMYEKPLTFEVKTSDDFIELIKFNLAFSEFYKTF